jgi:hypothetical protein
MTEYRTLGEFCDATAGPEYDEAIEATLQWMVAEMSKEADRRERDNVGINGLRFSAQSVRGLVEDKADLIRRYRAMVAERRAVS